MRRNHSILNVVTCNDVVQFDINIRLSSAINSKGLNCSIASKDIIATIVVTNKFQGIAPIERTRVGLELRKLSKSNMVLGSASTDAYRKVKPDQLNTN